VPQRLASRKRLAASQPQMGPFAARHHPFVVHVASVRFTHRCDAGTGIAPVTVRSCTCPDLLSGS